MFIHPKQGLRNTELNMLNEHEKHKVCLHFGVLSSTYHIYSYLEHSSFETSMQIYISFLWFVRSESRIVTK